MQCISTAIKITGVHQLIDLLLVYVQVDSVEKVAKLLEGENETSDGENQGTRWSKNDNSLAIDYNCLLIEVSLRMFSCSLS